MPKYRKTGGTRAKPAGFRRIFGLGLYPGIQDGAGPLPNGGGGPVMELRGVEIVILVGIQGDIGQLVVQTAMKFCQAVSQVSVSS